MHRLIFFFIVHLSLQTQLISLPVFARQLPGRTLLQNPNATSPCPLDFNILRQLFQGSTRRNLDTSTQCQYIRQSLRLVLSDYLRRTNSFLPPLSSADSCWQAYQSLVNEFVPSMDIRRSCGFQTSWISEGCMGINTRAQFESTVSQSALHDVVSNCNQSLENGSPCAACTTSLSSLLASYLTGPSVGNLTDCTAYGSIYAAAFANQFGPTDKGTAKCLFSLDFAATNSSNKRKRIEVSVIVVVGVVVLVVLFSGLWFCRQRRKRKIKASERWKLSQANSGSGPAASRLDSISGSTNLVRFTLDKIKAATKNFSRKNIIGRGGYGNVYKGVLPDGSEAALKRFKNCSAFGDATFMHEVEVIASIRHVNFVQITLLKPLIDYSNNDHK